jgi:multiple sugar transport system substrate-binding protein
MKTNTTLRTPQFRRFVLLGSALAGLALANTRAQVTVEVIHYFNVEGQLAALNEMQKEFETANPDIKLRFTFVPFGELVSRTLQMAAVRKPPAISAIDNPDVLRVAKAGILKDISADVAKIKVWEDIYPGPKAAVSDGSKVFGVPIGSNSLALYYNKKMLTEAGVTSPPKTWAELTETATKTTKSPVYGIAFSAVNDEQATWQWEPFLWSNGGSLTDLGGSATCMRLQPARSGGQAQARMPFTGWCSSTPVRRTSRPRKGWVKRLWSMPRQWSIVACRSRRWTGFSAML